MDTEVAGLGVAVKMAGGVKLGQSKVSRQLGGTPKEAEFRRCQLWCHHLCVSVCYDSSCILKYTYVHYVYYMHSPVRSYTEWPIVKCTLVSDELFAALHHIIIRSSVTVILWFFFIYLFEHLVANIALFSTSEQTNCALVISD